MIAKIKEILTKDAKVQVIGVQFGKELSYYLLKLSNQNNELFVKDRELYSSFDELSENLDKRSPVILNFSGKGVLNKKVKKEPDYKAKVLLNVNINDFYFYEVHQKNEVFVSVARKAQIEEQLTLFSEAKALVVDYSVGPFSGVSLLPFLEVNEVQSNKTLLQFENNTLIGFSSSVSEGNSVFIGDQELSNMEIPLFATAVNYYFPNEELVYENDFLQSNRLEKNYKKYFEFAGAITLGGFFIILLVSYLLLGHYQQKIVESDQGLKMLQETYGKVKTLEKERDDKKAILNESGVFTTNFLSFYINELTIGLPKTINLSTFLLFPTEKKVKQGEKIKLNSNMITIKGESSSNGNFNRWYKGLKKIKWVSKTDIVTYKANKYNRYDFEIKLTIK